jgi:hypothetical protein
MANGELTFLLLHFQYLVGWEKINLAISAAVALYAMARNMIM